MPFLLLIGLAFLAFAVYLVGEVAPAPARERQGSIRRAAHYGESRRRSSAVGEEPFRERVVSPAKTGLAHAVLRINPKTTVEGVSMKLLGAGLGRVLSPTTFLALKAMGAVGGFVGGPALRGVAR